jgi:hypothetical protein
MKACQKEAYMQTFIQTYRPIETNKVYILCFIMYCCELSMHYIHALPTYLLLDNVVFVE